MEPSGPEGRRGLSRLLMAPPTLLAAPLVGLGVLLAVDELTGPEIRIGGLMAAVPALSAVFLGPVAVAGVAMVTLGCVVLAASENRTLDTQNLPVVLITAVLVGVGSVMASVLRRRRERQLAQVRMVAGVAQRALLRPLPARLGRITISSMYLAADAEAAIGGDLYAAAPRGRGGARLLVGDVQGKGLAAVEVAGLLLAAFRRAVRADVPLAELPGCLDADLRDDLAELADLADLAEAADLADVADDGDLVHDRGQPAGPHFLEGFVTAVMIDVADDGGGLNVANCGHPPPLLVHGDCVEQLYPGVPDLPLGLGDLTRQTQHIDKYDMAVGDILLLYTDGVIEARDAVGTFYPLADRLARWTADSPDALLRAVRDDLLHYADARLGDDIAMVAVQRVS